MHRWLWQGSSFQAPSSKTRVSHFWLKLVCLNFSIIIYSFVCQLLLHFYHGAIKRTGITYKKAPSLGATTKSGKKVERYGSNRYPLHHHRHWHPARVRENVYCPFFTQRFRGFSPCPQYAQKYILPILDI